MKKQTKNKIVQILALVLAVSAHAQSGDLIHVAQDTQLRLEHTQNITAVFETYGNWNRYYEETLIHIKRMPMDEEENFVSSKARDYAKEEVMDYLVEFLPTMAQTTLKLIGNSLVYKIIAQVMDLGHTATPLKEAQLLNQEVTDTMMQALKRLNPQNNLEERLKEIENQIQQNSDLRPQLRNR